MDEIKEIEEEYNLFKKEIYPPSGSMEVLQDVVVHKFFNERVPCLLSYITLLESQKEELKEWVASKERIIEGYVYKTLELQAKIKELELQVKDLEKQKALIPWIGELAQAKVKVKQLTEGIEECLKQRMLLPFYVGHILKKLVEKK